MKKSVILSLCLVLVYFAGAQSLVVNPVITCRSGTYVQPHTVAKTSHHTSGAYSTIHFTLTSTATDGNRYCNGYNRKYRANYTRLYISSDPYWQSYDAKLSQVRARTSTYQTKTSTLTTSKRVYDSTLKNGYFQDKVYLLLTKQICLESDIDGICSCEPEQFVGIAQELNIIDRAFNEIQLDVQRLPNRSGYQYYRFEVDNIGTVLSNINYTWEFKVFNTYGGGWNVFQQTGNGTLNNVSSVSESGYLNLPTVSGSSHLIQLTIFPSDDQNTQNNKMTT